MAKKDFWKKQTKPIVALSPMDGYTDSPFRQVCKSVNPNIFLFTEFTSADGIHHDAKKVKERFRFDPSEHPVIAQIFGKDPATFVTAAKFCEEQGFDGIDINMGCPSKKVVKSEHGVALRKKPDLAYKLVEAVAEATSLPVSVKTRLGWSNAEDLIEFGKGCQDAGANLITIHGRTYQEPYSGPADWKPIYALKDALTIPVLGNGGIQSMAHAKERLGNLDGYMIGQGAIGNPWIFSHQPPPSLAEKVPLILKHAKLLFEYVGQRGASFEMRKHLLAYVKGIPNASTYRKQLVHIESLDDIRRGLDFIVSDLEQHQ